MSVDSMDILNKRGGTTLISREHPPLKLMLTYVVGAQWHRGRVSALRMVGCGLNAQLGHTKECKNEAYCLPARHLVFGVGLRGVRSPNETRVQHHGTPK